MRVVGEVPVDVIAGPWQREKMNRRRGVLIRLIMFERTQARFCENIIQSYQTTVLIEALFLNSLKRLSLRADIKVFIMRP